MKTGLLPLHLIEILKFIDNNTVKNLRKQAVLYTIGNDTNRHFFWSAI